MVEPAHEPVAPSQGGHVLCVDDEPYILSTVRRMLLNAGHTVWLASDGEAGLQCLRQTPSLELVISDQRMPGMDGLEFLHRVRQLRPDCACILMTGLGEQEEVHAAIGQGTVYRCLQKPWDRARFLQTVSDALAHAARLRASL